MLRQQSTSVSSQPTKLHDLPKNAAPSTATPAIIESEPPKIVEHPHNHLTLTTTLPDEIEPPQSCASQFANRNDLSEELAIVILQSFLYAFFKKWGLLSLNEAMSHENSQLKRFAMQALLVLAFALFGSQLFGYSFLFSLGMEAFNGVLRETGNERLTKFSGIVFYGPGVVENLLNPKSSPAPVLMLSEKILRSAVSGVSASVGWYLAGLFAEEERIRRRRLRPLVPVHLIKNRDEAAEMKKGK